jgi:hypothetical protein
MMGIRLADQGVTALQVRVCGASGIVPGGSVASGASARRGRVAWRRAEGGGKQLLDLVDGERDQARVSGRWLVRPGGRRLMIGAGPEVG